MTYFPIHLLGVNGITHYYYAVYCVTRDVISNTPLVPQNQYTTASKINCIKYINVLGAFLHNSNVNTATPLRRYIGKYATQGVMKVHSCPSGIRELSLHLLWRIFRYTYLGGHGITTIPVTCGVLVLNFSNSNTNTAVKYSYRKIPSTRSSENTELVPFGDEFGIFKELVLGTLRYQHLAVLVL